MDQADKDDTELDLSQKWCDQKRQGCLWRDPQWSIDKVEELVVRKVGIEIHELSCINDLRDSARSCVCSR